MHDLKESFQGLQGKTILLHVGCSLRLMLHHISVTLNLDCMSETKVSLANNGFES